MNKEEFVTTYHLTLLDPENQYTFIKEVTRIPDDMEALEEFVVICCKHMIQPQLVLDSLVRKSVLGNLNKDKTP